MTNKVKVIIVITVLGEDSQLAKSCIELTGIPISHYDVFPVKMGTVVDNLLGELKYEALDALGEIHEEVQEEIGEE